MVKVYHVLDDGKPVPIVIYDIEDATLKEAVNYFNYVKSRVKTPIKAIEVKMCADGKVDVSYDCEGTKFERIRRITGYLTGDMSSWNNAKQAEEKERVKHTCKE